MAFANGSKVAFQAFLMWVKEQTRLVCQTAQFWSPYIIFAFIWFEDFQNAYNVLKFWCRLPCIEHVREMSHQLHPWGYLSMVNQPCGCHHCHANGIQQDLFEEPLGLKETLYHGALFENDNRNFFWAQMIIKLNLIEIMEKNVESFEAFRECLDDQNQTDYSVQTKLKNCHVVMNQIQSYCLGFSNLKKFRQEKANQSRLIEEFLKVAIYADIPPVCQEEHTVL